MMKWLHCNKPAALIILLLFIFIPRRSGAPGGEAPRSTGGRLTIWAHSDIQPRNGAEMIHYEIAVDDVAANIPGIYMAIVAGDIVHRRDAAHMYYQWFLDTRARAAIPYWYEIAGNHDENDIGSYRHYINKPLHYTVQVGNVLIIFMSDEIRSAVTDISDNVFRWWKDLVVRNQDKILITVTHGCLAQSGLLATVNPTMTIRGSERFAKVLEHYPVDLWLSAHSHLPHYLRGKWSHTHRFSKTMFVDISAIRQDRWNTVESYFLTFNRGDALLSIVPRDHIAHRFLSRYAVTYTLRTRFQWDTSSPVVTPYTK